MTAAHVQRITIRAMWMSLNVVNLRARHRFLSAHPSEYTGESVFQYALDARSFERAIAALADELIAHLRAAARGAA